MAINVIDGNSISIPAAARLLPSRSDKGVSVPTINRWILRGIRVNGCLVKLEAVRVGGQWFTTKEALREFIEKQNPPVQDAASSTDGTPKQSSGRRKQVEAAERDLERAGI